MIFSNMAYPGKDYRVQVFDAWLGEPFEPMDNPKDGDKIVKRELGEDGQPVVSEELVYSGGEWVEGGGGGSSTVVVYDGSIETALDGNYAYSADTDVQNEFAFDFSTDPPTFPDLTIVFEGVTYEVQYESGNGWGAPWDDDNNTYDFTDYPFNVYPANISKSGIWEQFNISTATAGEYDIKISGIPNGSGGGESDYSTCTVTLVVDVSPDTTCPWLFIVPHLYNNAMETYISYTSATTYELETVLYHGGVYAYTFDKVRRTVSGNATIGSYDGTGYPITILGDCTITIGGDK